MRQSDVKGTVWGGVVVLGFLIVGMASAQAQDIRAQSIRQLVNGPLFLHQGGPITQLFQITGTPGNPMASQAAVAQSQRLIRFGSLPTAAAQYDHLLQSLGIVQAVEQQGASFRLKQMGQHQVTGSAACPTLIFPVQLQESPTPQGPWAGHSYTLRLTYVGHTLKSGLSVDPILSAIHLEPR